MSGTMQWYLVTSYRMFDAASFLVARVCGKRHLRTAESLVCAPLFSRSILRMASVQVSILYFPAWSQGLQKPDGERSEEAAAAAFQSLGT